MNEVLQKRELVAKSGQPFNGVHLHTPLDRDQVNPRIGLAVRNLDRMDGKNPKIIWKLQKIPV